MADTGPWNRSSGYAGMTVLGPSGPYRDVAFCHGARTICVTGRDPLSQVTNAFSLASHQPEPGISGIACTLQPPRAVRGL